MSPQQHLGGSGLVVSWEMNQGHCKSGLELLQSLEKDGLHLLLWKEILSVMELVAAADDLLYWCLNPQNKLKPLLSFFIKLFKFPATATSSLD